MTRWSPWTEPFDVPPGKLDVYQTLQRLRPGACVGAHLHDGPENGLVIAGSVTRWEVGTGKRELTSEASFVTPASVAHATGNTSTTVAEQITLHVLPRGAAFAHPCSCAKFPAAAPGSTSRVRVCFPVDASSPCVRARHSAFAVNGKLAIPASNDALFLAVLDGELVVAEHRMRAGEGFEVPGRPGGTLLRGSSFVIMTEIRHSA